MDYYIIGYAKNKIEDNWQQIYATKKVSIPDSQNPYIFIQIAFQTVYPYFIFTLKEAE